MLHSQAMKKVGRNDPCPCGSGKKFKKCCEPKAIGGKFLATKIESSTPMTSLFNRVVTPISLEEKKTDEAKS